jgi:hypothetical protein
MVSYPNLDMGEIKSAFDGDGNSLIRTLEINPMRMVIKPIEILTLNQVTVRIGGTASTVTIRVIPSDGSAKYELIKEVPESNDIRDIIFMIENAAAVDQIEIEIVSLH